MIVVQLFGTLHVVRDGVGVKVTGAKERALLALLAIHGGKVVSTDRIADVLWGDNLPDKPVNAVQAVVSRLRRALGPDGPVATRKPGYLLRLEGVRIDTRQFEELVTRARDVAPGDPASASRLFEEALSLWRGGPFADLADHDFTRPERTRLEELRAAAHEEHAEVRLQLGDHAALVPELERIVAEHPLRERPRAQLMLALYRCARQADALGVYDATRRVLRDELGLYPSPELQDLQARILRQDPSLLPSTPLAAATRGDNLPGRLTSFIGRELERDALGGLLSEHRLITVTGTGGVGKTSLAVEVARGMHGTFPNGIWFVDLAPLCDGSQVADAVLAVVAPGDRTGNEARAVADPVERLTRALQRRQTLVLLDNCEHVVKPCAHFIEELLTACDGVSILTTSRDVLDVPGETVFVLTPLSIPSSTPGEMDPRHFEAVRLFIDRAATARPDTASADPDLAAVVQICRRLEGIPLAIELAAARTRTLPVDLIAQRLDDQFGLLTNGNRTAALRQQTLRATMDWSYDLLFDAERTLFARLALFAGPWGIADVEAVCADDSLPVSDVMDLVSRLADRSLVTLERGGPGRYRMLETMRAYAWERLQEAGGVVDLQRRHAGHFLRVAEEAGAQPATAERLRALEDARDDIRAALAWAVATDDDETALRFAGALGWYWATWRQREGSETLRAVLGPRNRRASHHLGRALQASAFVESYAPTEAIRARAIRSVGMLERFGDAPGAARSRLILAFIEMTMEGEASPAGSLVDSATAALAGAGDRWGEALAWLTRFRIYLHTGRLSESIPVGQEARRRFQALGDLWGVPWTTIWLAVAMRMLGDVGAARRLLQEAVSASERLPYANCLAHAELGNLATLDDDHELARHHVERALSIAPETGVRAALGIAYDAAGFGARHRGDLIEARSLHWYALAIHDELGSDTGRAESLCHLGFVEHRLGSPETALRRFEEALDLAQRTGRQDLIAATLEGLACSVAERAPIGAAAFLGAAHSIRQTTGIRLTMIEGHEPKQTETQLQSTLGPECFATAIDNGTRASPQEILRHCMAEKSS